MANAVARFGIAGAFAEPEAWSLQLGGLKLRTGIKAAAETTENNQNSHS